jgi:hypothetical protein
LSALFLATAALSTTGLTATLLLSTWSLTIFVLVVWHCRNSCRYPAKPDNIKRGDLFRKDTRHQGISLGTPTQSFVCDRLNQGF